MPNLRCADVCTRNEGHLTGGPKRRVILHGYASTKVSLPILKFLFIGRGGVRKAAALHLHRAMVVVVSQSLFI